MNTQFNYSCCIDSNGKKKNLYPTYEQAFDVKEDQERKNPGLVLEIYKCDSGEGYHLRKHY